MEKKPVNVQLNDFSLKNVYFDLQKCEENKEYKIQFLDDININIIDEVSFSILYTRKAFNESPFKLEVSYGVTVRADKSGLEQNNETIEQFADRKKQDIVRKVAFPSRASVLISEITRESGSVLVTVPGIITNKQKGETENGGEKN